MECGVEAPGGAGGSGDRPLSHQCLVSQAVGLMRQMEVLLSLKCPRDPPRNMHESWVQSHCPGSCSNALVSPVVIVLLLLTGASPRAWVFLSPEFFLSLASDC